MIRRQFLLFRPEVEKEWSMKTWIFFVSMNTIIRMGYLEQINLGFNVPLYIFTSWIIELICVPVNTTASLSCSPTPNFNAEESKLMIMKRKISNTEGYFQNSCAEPVFMPSCVRASKASFTYLIYFSKAEIADGKNSKQKSETKWREREKKLADRCYCLTSVDNYGGY